MGISCRYEHQLTYLNALVSLNRVMVFIVLHLSVCFEIKTPTLSPIPVLKRQLTSLLLKVPLMPLLPCPKSAKPWLWEKPVSLLSLRRNINPQRFFLKIRTLPRGLGSARYTALSSSFLGRCQQCLKTYGSFEAAQLTSAASAWRQTDPPAYVWVPLPETSARGSAAGSSQRLCCLVTPKPNEILLGASERSPAISALRTLSTRGGNPAFVRDGGERARAHQ